VKSRPTLPMLHGKEIIIVLINLYRVLNLGTQQNSCLQHPRESPGLKMDIVELKIKQAYEVMH
jgi:hypothetical protein